MCFETLRLHVKVSIAFVSRCRSSSSVNARIPDKAGQRNVGVAGRSCFPCLHSAITLIQEAPREIPGQISQWG